MCGRYASARSVDDIASAFGIRDADVDAGIAPDWNVAPTKQVPVVLVRNGRRVLTPLRWGLVPSWATDPSIGARLINARIETVAEKPAFRDALTTRRCVVPADGWYEWQQRPDGERRPHFLRLADGGMVAFAGLWETWYDAAGRPLRSATILTGPAPSDLATIHDRAPVVLDGDAWRDWLDPDGDPRTLLRPTPSGVVVAHPVSPLVGDVRENGAHLVEPAAVVEQPPLF